MIVKKLYAIPGSNLSIVELRDGGLYTFETSPAREITESDLTKVDVSPEKYLFEVGAVAYEGSVEELQMKAYGMAKNAVLYYRWKRGMTQQQLVAASGVSRKQIYLLEAGLADAGNYTARNLVAIADALSVDIHELL